MDADQIERRIAAEFRGATVRVLDTTGSGDHFEALVVSDLFRGKLPVVRHRMVYAALGSSVGHEIHALALMTLTPEQWESEQQAGEKA